MWSRGTMRLLVCWVSSILLLNGAVAMDQKPGQSPVAAIEVAASAKEGTGVKTATEVADEAKARSKVTSGLHMSAYATEAMKAADAALQKIVAFTDTSGKLYDYSFAEVRSGDEAHDIFCKCLPHPSMGKALWEMCPGITEQCKRTFCKPLCLRMAWHPKLTIDCTRAPGWKWCHKFAAQVRQAEKAILAQFQAHVCLDLHFCNSSHHINEWIENHAFGNQYPKPHLPLQACTHHDKITKPQEEMLCAACEAVVDVEIERGECLAPYKTLQPGSLQERCMYLADVIGNRKEFLLRVFKERVCSCMGCCDSRKCFFQDPEVNWLNELVSGVQDRVTAELEAEGWTIMHKKVPRGAPSKLDKYKRIDKEM